MVAFATPLLAIAAADSVLKLIPFFTKPKSKSGVKIAVCLKILSCVRSEAWKRAGGWGRRQAWGVGARAAQGDTGHGWRQVEEVRL